MYPRLLITRETVVAVTPARAAMSLIVAFAHYSTKNLFSVIFLKKGTAVADFDVLVKIAENLLIRFSLLCQMFRTVL